MKVYLPFLCILLAFGCQPSLSAQTRQRAVILTDIENEPDDTQSLVRLLLYSDEIDIRGLIATTSTHMRHEVHPESIQKVIDGYEAVRPNLLLHDSSFPQADLLRSVVKKGLPVYGKAGIGKSCDSEGSNWIIQELERHDSRPLWICAWGGTNVLAQALYELRCTKSPQELSRLIGKLRVYTISDQDDTGYWIRRNFPRLFYIVSPGGYGNATWSGMFQTTEGHNNEEVSNSWIARNIQQGHGPLGACYPDVAYGMEGDTPSWLCLIPNGLNAPEHPNWGGWGGRYEYYQPRLADCDPNGFNGHVTIEAETHAIWTNAKDSYSPYVSCEYGCAVKPDTTCYQSPQVSVWRWREDVQNDFAARMDWCVKSYGSANHAPKAKLSHANELVVKGGEQITLDASPSTDPDGDTLSFLWFCYPEVGSGRQVFTAGAPNMRRVSVVAPHVKQPEDIHFILRVTDKGIPRLSRYQRVILHVKP